MTRAPRLELLDLDVSRVRACERGTNPYGVTVGLSDEDASWSCTCPVGEDGSMCKHVVAVAGRRSPSQRSVMPTTVSGSAANGLDHDNW